MNNIVRVDWFSATIKCNSKSDINFIIKIITDILLLDIEQFSLNNFGLNRYNHHYSLGDINFYFSLDKYGKLSKEMGVNIQMKGKGCRQYEEYLQGNENNWVSLIDRILIAKGNFTRLDIANDLYESTLNIQTIHSYCRNGLCISNAKGFEYHEKGQLDNGEIVGETVNIGSKGSNGQQLGIYNKKMEQLSKGKLNKPIEYWVRVELRLFGEKAQIFAKEMAKKRPLKDIFFEVVNDSYRFVVDDRYSNDKNKRRRQTVGWWKDYLATQSKTTLSFIREKRTLMDKEEYLKKQASKSLFKLFKGKQEIGGDKSVFEFLEEILKMGEEKMTENDWKEVAQYVTEQTSVDYWEK